MHACETIEVAALLRLGARGLIEDSPRLSETALSEYWAASRCRIDEWTRSLRSLRSVVHDERPTREIAEEVLASQPLTRVVAALAVAHDRRRGTDEAAPIARNIADAHSEAAARLRRLLDRHDAYDFRQLRRRVERWTDLLLGSVAPLCGTPGVAAPAGHAIEFAFEPARVQDFAYDATLHSVDAAGGAATGALLLAAVRSAFGGSATAAANPALNRRVAGATLGLFGPELFDDYGLLRSTLTARLERTTDETFGLVEQFFEEPAAASGGLPTRWQ